MIPFIFRFHTSGKEEGKRGSGCCLVAWLAVLSFLITPILATAEDATDPALAPDQAEHIVKDQLPVSIDSCKSQQRLATGIVDSIIILGNNSTHRSVIVNEMSLRPGSDITLESITRDRKRLESLGLFSRVEICTAPSSNGVNLVITVTELWYIWPGIYLAVDEDVPSRVSYGIIVNHMNFRGRAEDLSVAGYLGNAKGAEIRWKIPYIAEGPDWFAEFKGKSIQETEPLFLSSNDGIMTRETVVEGKLGHRLNQEVSFWIKGGLEIRSFDLDGATDTTRLITASGEENDWLVDEEFGFQIDTRHYKPWASQGCYFKLLLEAAQTVNASNVSYFRPNIELAHYYELFPHIIWAGKVYGAYTFGESTVYRRILLDSNHLVRTTLPDAFEGDNSAAASGELRFDVLPITYVTFQPAFDMLRQYTRNLKFGVSMILFGDIGAVNGSTWAPDDPYSLDTGGWDAAYGAGLVVHVPYRDVVRVELSRSARFPDEGLVVKLRVGAAF